ncbi:Rho GTPase-activating protein gacW [Cucumispora dikerogammari]|nr:Rho GTPase-activating protein gacW [Cucumispora dikerogammari]
MNIKNEAVINSSELDKSDTSDTEDVIVNEDSIVNSETIVNDEDYSNRNEDIDTKSVNKNVITNTANIGTHENNNESSNTENGSDVGAIADTEDKFSDVSTINTCDTASDDSLIKTERTICDNTMDDTGDATGDVELVNTNGPLGEDKPIITCTDDALGEDTMLRTKTSSGESSIVNTVVPFDNTDEASKDGTDENIGNINDELVNNTETISVTSFVNTDTVDGAFVTAPGAMNNETFVYEGTTCTQDSINTDMTFKALGFTDEHALNTQQGENTERDILNSEIKITECVDEINEHSSSHSRSRERSSITKSSNHLTIGDQKQQILKDSKDFQKHENYILTPIFKFQSRKRGYSPENLSQLITPEAKLEYPIEEYKEYNTLSDREKLIISHFCVYKIGKHICGNQSVTEKIKSFFISENLIYFDRKPITSNVFGLIEYLKYNNDTLGLFRAYSNPIVYRQISSKLDSDVKIEFEKYKQEDLACAFKSYLRDDLNGIFSKSIVASLYFAFRTSDISLLIRISKYLPFSISPEKRDLFIAILQMYESISLNSKKNKMTLKNLIISSAPSFFPRIDFVDLNVCHYQALILETFIKEVQMNYVHNSIYDEAIEFGKGVIVSSDGKITKVSDFSRLCF